MPKGKAVTEAEARQFYQRALALPAHCRTTGRALSTAMGLTHATCEKWLHVILPRFGLRVELSGLPLAQAAPAEDPLAERLRRLEGRTREAEAKARELQAELDRDSDLRAAVFGLGKQSLQAPAWTAPRQVKGKVVTVPLLMASDFQWGEVIRASELDGINGFDSATAERRYKRLIERTVQIARDHMGQHHTYPGIVYARLGDMVSGDIHEELRETNDLQSIPAVKHLVECEVAGLRVLAEVFGRVHVVSVPGNHGRVTHKPHAKRFAETNYDTLSAWWLESQLSADKRFTWQTPKSGDALVPIAGHTWLFTHGDRIGSRGGEGFIGPVATIARGFKRLVDYYATLGTVIDYIGIGHFHTRLELEYGYVNGSLPGFSEYAKSGRLRPAEPSQWLLFVHQEHGVTARWPVLLEPKPRLNAANALFQRAA